MNMISSINNLKEITIQIEQKSIFLKEIPFSYFKKDIFSYGSYYGLHLVENKMYNNSFLFYENKKIARGIFIQYSEDKSSSVSLTLKLPTSISEIRLFIYTCLYISRYWTCSILFQNNPLTSTGLMELEEYIVERNLHVLQEFVQESLYFNKIHELECARHTLYFGYNEANILLPIISSSKFENWLHDKQKNKIYIPDLVIRKKNEKDIFSVYIPLDIPLLLANHSSRYINENQILEAYFYEDGNELFPILYDYFMTVLPQEKKHYFDAFQMQVDSISKQEMEFYLNI